MISRLSGTLIEKQPPFLLMEVAGVGYEVQASMNTFYRLPDIGSTIVLHTHFVVREDAQLLYGFFEQRERALFRTLIKVNGIGPKIALTILSSIEPDAFVRCVELQDTSSLQRLPGIGKKTAERLIVEMRDRFSDWQTDTTLAASSSDNPGITSHAEQDAISALIALGYKPQEASRAVTRVGQEGLTSQELIKLALQGVVA